MEYNLADLFENAADAFADQDCLEQCRVRYRFYKDQGHSPETHKI